MQCSKQERLPVVPVTPTGAGALDARSLRSKPVLRCLSVEPASQCHILRIHHEGSKPVGPPAEAPPGAANPRRIHTVTVVTATAAAVSLTVHWHCTVP